ncbi:MAG: hypothetical protein JWM39_347 [Parcubacteria group bacterium]|nr:hypothetical protein [Parcubacteria group bacterium]
MDRSKQYANWASGILGFAAPTYFAWTIYQTGVPQNVATWGMTVLLDALGLFLVIRGGNKLPLLQIAWLSAACLILIAILAGRSPWHWGIVESASLVLCFIAVVLWLTLSAEIAIFAFVIAFIVATVPLIVDYWHTPQSSTTWLWLVTIVSCALSIYGAKKQDVAHTAVPWGAIALNSFIAFLCVR